MVMADYQKDIRETIRQWVNSDDTDVLERLRGLAEQRDPSADEPLDGESLRLSLTSLNEKYPDGYQRVVSSDCGREFVDELVNFLPVYACDNGVELGTRDEEGWEVEWVNPPEDMFISPGDGLSGRYDEMIAVRGRVATVTKPMVTATEVMFQCQRCSTGRSVPQMLTKVDGLTEPHQCNGCEREGPFAVMKDQTKMTDWQYLRVEERMSDTSLQTQPEEIDCYLFGEARTDRYRRGGDIIVVGRIDVDIEEVGAEPYLNLSSAVPQSELHTDVTIKNEDHKAVKQFIEGRGVEELAAEYVAPSIHGAVLAKTAALISAIGHGQLDHEMAKDRRMHMMMVGEPQTGKSVIAESLNDIVPKSRFANASGSSKVGLLAAAEKEDVAGKSRWVLRAGAMALVSGGVLCLDELDKTEFEVSDLNEALTQGNVYIDKAASGSVQTDCSVVAACNSRGDTLDPSVPISQQVDFDDSLLSRFDLVLPFVRTQDAERLSGIASSATNAFSGEMDGMESYQDDIKLVRKWIYLARQADPGVPYEVAEYVSDAWENIQKKGKGIGIDIGERRLWSMHRLAKAHARAKLRDEVLMEDAEWAVEMIRQIMKAWGWAPDGDSPIVTSSSVAVTDGGADDADDADYTEAQYKAAQEYVQCLIDEFGKVPETDDAYTMMANRDEFNEDDEDAAWTAWTDAQAGVRGGE